MFLNVCKKKKKKILLGGGGAGWLELYWNFGLSLVPAFDMIITIEVET